MNVNMHEHQRSILAALGIDCWVPKADASVRVYASGLYRDQAAPEQNWPVLDHQQIRQNQQNSLHGEQSEVSIITKKIEADVVEYVETELTEPEQVEITPESKPLYIAPFTLQAVVFDRCVVALDATELSNEQMKLWLNIQAALQGQYHELKWPFNLPQLQDGKGVHVYAKGFFDALIEDRRFIILGKLPQHALNGFDQDYTELSSLQEMLDQPLLKRQLWEAMQK